MSHRQVVYSLLLNGFLAGRSYAMSKCNYLSVGIDVGSAFSWISIVDTDENLLLKPFNIIHNNINSLERDLCTINKTEY